MHCASACLLASQCQTIAVAARKANPQELWMLHQRYENNQEHQHQLAALQNKPQMAGLSAGMTTFASIFTAPGANPTMAPTDVMPGGYNPHAIQAMAGSATLPNFMGPTQQSMKALPAEFSILVEAQQKHANSLFDNVPGRNFPTPQVPIAQSQKQQTKIIEWSKHQKEQVEAVGAVAYEIPSAVAYYAGSSTAFQHSQSRSETMAMDVGEISQLSFPSEYSAGDEEIPDSFPSASSTVKSILSDKAQTNNNNHHSFNRGECWAWGPPLSADDASLEDHCTTTGSSVAPYSTS